MKHKGRARTTAFKWIFWSLLVLLGVFATGIIAKYLHFLIAWLASALVVVWVVAAGFILYFFRDPDPVMPQGSGLVVSPAHGTVDCIEELDGLEFLGGRCRRVSIFLSPLNIHVQYAPVHGRLVEVKHQPGEFRPATSPSCGLHNENVFLGFESPEVPGGKLAIRVIAGILARRIIPWAEAGDLVARSERISIVQFGSRCDVYLPLALGVAVKLGDKVKGGETVLARIQPA